MTYWWMSLISFTAYSINWCSILSETILLGGFNPFEQYVRQHGFIFPQISGVKIPNIFETATGLVERTVLVPWLLGNVVFHMSYEHNMFFETTT